MSANFKWPWVILDFLVPWMSPLAFYHNGNDVFERLRNETTWFHRGSRSRPLHHLPGDHHVLSPATVKSGFTLRIWTCNKYSLTYTTYPYFIQKCPFHPNCSPIFAFKFSGLYFVGRVVKLQLHLSVFTPKGSPESLQDSQLKDQPTMILAWKTCHDFPEVFSRDRETHHEPLWWNSSPGYLPFFTLKMFLKKTSLWWKVGYFLCPLRDLTLYLGNCMLEILILDKLSLQLSLKFDVQLSTQICRKKTVKKKTTLLIFSSIHALNKHL